MAMTWFRGIRYRFQSAPSHAGATACTLSAGPGSFGNARFAVNRLSCHHRCGFWPRLAAGRDHKRQQQSKPQHDRL